MHVPLGRILENPAGSLRASFFTLHTSYATQDWALAARGKGNDMILPCSKPVEAGASYDVWWGLGEGE